MNNKLIGIEIESPYRYRAYWIGREAKFNIQNDDYIAIEGLVESIEETHCIDTDGSLYVRDINVYFANGNFTVININNHNIIKHYERVEVE